MAVDPQPEGEFFSVRSACGHVTLSALTAAADRLSNRFSRSGWERVGSKAAGATSEKLKLLPPPHRRGHGALFGEVFALRKGDSRPETASCREGA